MTMYLVQSIRCFPQRTTADSWKYDISEIKDFFVVKPDKMGSPKAWRYHIVQLTKTVYNIRVKHKA